jgi:hypothetical protein
MGIIRELRRVMLMLLSALPFASVALAAEGALVQMAGEDATAALESSGDSLDAILRMKSLLFEPYATETTWEAARERFERVAEAGSWALDPDRPTFDATVKYLKERNLLEVKESNLVAAITSRLR